MHSIDESLKLAKQKGNFTQRVDPVSETEIEQLEKKFSVVLPDDYRYFLKHYGAVSWRGGLIPGLPGENDKFRDSKDIFAENEYFRDHFGSRKEYGQVPNGGIIVGKYSGGGYYFIYSKDGDRSGEVALYLTELWGKESEFWDSFKDYLSYRVTGKPSAHLS